MSLTTSLTLSSDAWRLLRGVTCLYKPPGFSAGKLVNMLKHNLEQDLNRMERKVDRDERKLHLTGGSEGDIIPGSGDVGVAVGHGTDYSVHPLVLGPGYTTDDIRCMYVNKLSDNASGVLLVGVNESQRVTEGKALRNAKLLTTFHVRGEWGRATSTGWATGKTRFCSTWRHLAGRPWLVDQCLSNIQASHQARAWTVANCALDTQEAYEKALEGPVKPDMLSETLVYGIKVKEWKLPNFMMEVQCVEGQDDMQKYLVRLVEEIGLKCKTVAHVTDIRCAAVGPFTSDESLLIKHLSLQNVLNNISDNRKLWREANHGKRSERGFRKKELEESSNLKDDKNKNKFTRFLSD